MNIIVALYSVVLFFVLTPNVLTRLPSNGSKMTVAMVHAAIFGIILYFTQNIVDQFSRSIVEGAKGRAPAKPPAKPPAKAAPGKPPVQSNAQPPNKEPARVNPPSTAKAIGNQFKSIITSNPFAKLRF